MAKRRSVSLDDEARAAMLIVPVVRSILAHDPGSKSAGLAFIVDGQVAFSTQGHPADVAARWQTLMRHQRPDFYVREGPYPSVRDTPEREWAQSRALYEMAHAAGWLECALRHSIDLVPKWVPAPSTWRAVLGLNRRARDETNDAIVEWARATTKLQLVTARGAACVDEANAIALAYATAACIRSVKLHGVTT